MQLLIRAGKPSESPTRELQPIWDMLVCLFVIIRYHIYTLCMQKIIIITLVVLKVLFISMLINAMNTNSTMTFYYTHIYTLYIILKNKNKTLVYTQYMTIYICLLFLNARYPVVELILYLCFVNLIFYIKLMFMISIFNYIIYLCSYLCHKYDDASGHSRRKSAPGRNL